MIKIQYLVKNLVKVDDGKYMNCSGTALMGNLLRNECDNKQTRIDFKEEK